MIIPATSIAVQDETTLQGYVGTLNFAGAGVTASVSGDTATVTIAGGGGGGATATRATVVLPYPAMRTQTVNVVDATVSATSRLNVWTSGLAPEVVGSDDAVDVFHIRPLAKAGSFDVALDFLTPFAGSLSIDYMVLA